jgi:multidrug resistance protein
MTTSEASHSEDTLAKDIEDNEIARQRTTSSHNGLSETSPISRRQSLEREFTKRDYIMVRWDPGEPANPYNWSRRRKFFIVFVGMLQVINSTMGSAIPSGAVQEIGQHFGITSSQQLTMPISSYLIGYVVGPLVFGPLSETYGRKMVMLSSFIMFTIWTMASALANNFTALCFFRLFAGIFASSPIVVIGGLYADIYYDPVTRGKAMAIFMACTTWGPTLSPMISGFIATVSWQWTFWVGLIFAGACLPVIAALPETYGPILLLHKARRLRKENPDKKYLAKIELESTEVRDIVTRVIFRPISMILHEGIVSFTCLYLSLIYSIFYLYFEAFPIVFQGTYTFLSPFTNLIVLGMYHLSAGVAGLAFIPIAVGSFVAFFIFLGWDAYLRRSQRLQKPWSFGEEYQRLPLAIIGGPALSAGVFWLAWAAFPYVHPIVPMLSGIPFGIGFLLIFMALINYLADAYDIYAASALAATSTTRSVFGAVLPLAAEPMYKTLGVHWATSLLGFASAVMILIPVAFIRFGPYLRRHSKFSLELKELKETEEREDRRAEAERKSRRESEMEPGDLEKSIENNGGENAVKGTGAGKEDVDRRAMGQEKDITLEKKLEAEAGPDRGETPSETPVEQSEQFFQAPETPPTAT